MGRLLLIFNSILIWSIPNISAQVYAQSENSFRVESSYPFHNVYASAWSPDSKYLAVIEKNMGRVKIIEPLKSESSPIISIETEIASELSSRMSWSPDSKFLLLQYIKPKSLTPTLQVYHVQDRRLIYELLPRKKYPSWVSDWLIKGEWSPEGRYILFYSSSHGTKDDLIPENLFVIDLAKKDPNKIVFKRFIEVTRDTNNNLLHYVHWSPDGKLISGVHTTSNLKPRLYVFDPFSDNEVFELIPSTPENSACSIQNEDVKWSPNSRWILAAYKCSGSLTTNMVLDPKKKFPNEALVLSYQSGSSSVSWTPDSQKLWSFNDWIPSSDLTLIPIVSGNVQKRYELYIDGRGSKSALLSPNGRYLVYDESGSYSRPKGGGLKIFDLEKEKIVFAMPSLKLMYWEVQWSPDSKMISLLEQEAAKSGNFLLRLNEK